jgi:hypothetical protein
MTRGDGTIVVCCFTWLVFEIDRSTDPTTVDARPSRYQERFARVFSGLEKKSSPFGNIVVG